MLDSLSKGEHEKEHKRTLPLTKKYHFVPAHVPNIEGIFLES